MLLLALALAPGCAGAQAPGVPPAAAPPDTLLRGTVRDAVSGAPVPGALVRVAAGSWSPQSRTDESGRYYAHVPPARPVHISVEAYGYASLTVDVVALNAGVPMDFALTPEPLPLSELIIRGQWPTPIMATLMSRPSSPTGPAERLVETTLERDRIDVLAPLLQVVDAASAARSDAGAAGGADGSGILGVRGYLTRRGATFVDGVPAAQARPVSWLADPFATSLERSRVEVWDAGAPARVTGGAEYETSLEHLPPAPDPGVAWQGSVDVVRSSGDIGWRGDRLAAEASGYATSPWSSGLVGEDGHESRAANVAAWAIPRADERLAVSGSVRRESLPAGGGPDAGAAHLSEGLGSLRWQSRAGAGSVEAVLGMSRSDTSLPTAFSYPGRPPAFTVREDRSRVALDYRRPVGRSLAVDVGADRLGFRWRGSAPASTAVEGVYGEAAWVPGPRFGLRAGARLDHGPATGNVRGAPRVHLDWRPTPGLELTLGSGVHHEAVLEPTETGALVGVRPLLVTGTHYRAGADFAFAGLGWSLGGYVKRLAGRGGVPDALHVWGAGLGVDASTVPGRLSVAATLERRSERGTVSWSPLFQADLDRRLSARTRLRLRVGASRSADAQVFGGTIADSLQVVIGGSAADSLTLAGSQLGKWTVQSDVELDRTLLGGDHRPVLRLYVQVLNVAGDELRPLFLEGTGARGVYLPRAFVVGLAVSSRTTSVSRRGQFVR